MVTEAPKTQPTLENVGKEHGLYTHSSWETAFDAEIQRRFGTSLPEPSIDSHGRLVRVSSLAAVNNKLLAFQYTRFDILKSKGFIVDAYTHQHSGVAASERSFDNVLDQLRAEMEEEERVEKALKAVVLARDGKIDTYRALTDPRYYLEGIAVQRWPEKFEFVLFEGKTSVDQNSQSGLIGRHHNFNGKRPDTYGALSLPPCFEGVRHNRNTDGKLVITYPKSFYETARAYAIAFSHETLNSVERSGLEIEDIDWFPTSKPIEEHQVFPDFNSPEQVMGKFGLFIQELAQPQ